MNASPIGRLLEEISWEGKNVRAYRDGGRGRENVLTTEVISALDALPRGDFLGAIVANAHGAPDVRRALVEEIEDATIAVLPDETVLDSSVVVQPDATIHSSSVYALVEVKRIRRSSFQVHQLAREWDAAHQVASTCGLLPLLFLILEAAPPVSVRRLGRLELAEAANWNRGEPLDASAIDRNLAWITWSEIREVVDTATSKYGGGESLHRTVHRLAAGVTRSIDWHS